MTARVLSFPAATHPLTSAVDWIQLLDTIVDLYGSRLPEFALEGAGCTRLGLTLAETEDEVRKFSEPIVRCVAALTGCSSLDELASKVQALKSQGVN